MVIPSDPTAPRRLDFASPHHHPPPSDAAAAPAIPRRGDVLPDFSFPTFKTWGNKLLCGLRSSDSKPHAGRRCAGSRIWCAASEGDEDVGLDEIREKLLVHLREAADRMKLVAPATPSSPSETTPCEAGTAAGDEAALPWKLRARRPRMLDEAADGGGDGEWRTRALATPAPATEKRSSPRRAGKRSSATRARAKFSIALTREEIDEDIYAVTGARARGRPRKRPRAVQKQLDLLFPGFWLSEITAESYRVPE